MEHWSAIMCRLEIHTEHEQCVEELSVAQQKEKLSQKEHKDKVAVLKRDLDAAKADLSEKKKAFEQTRSSKIRSLGDAKAKLDDELRAIQKRQEKLLQIPGTAVSEAAASGRWAVLDAMLGTGKAVEAATKTSLEDEKVRLGEKREGLEQDLKENRKRQRESKVQEELTGLKLQQGELEEKKKKIDEQLKAVRERAAEENKRKKEEEKKEAEALKKREAEVKQMIVEALSTYATELTANANLIGKDELPQHAEVAAKAAGISDIRVWARELADLTKKEGELKLKIAETQKEVDAAKGKTMQEGFQVINLEEEILEAEKERDSDAKQIKRRVDEATERLKQHPSSFFGYFARKWWAAEPTGISAAGQKGADKIKRVTGKAAGMAAKAASIAAEMSVGTVAAMSGQTVGSGGRAAASAIARKLGSKVPQESPNDARRIFEFFCFEARAMVARLEEGLELTERENANVQRDVIRCREVVSELEQTGTYNYLSEQIAKKVIDDVFVPTNKSDKM